MAVQGLCPNCQAQLRVSDDLAGKMIRCGKCGTTFTLPSQTPAEEPAVFATPADVGAAIQAPAEQPSVPASIPQVELAEREDRDPRREPRRRAKQGSSGTVWVLLGIGALGLLVVVCTGVAGVAWWWLVNRGPAMQPMAAERAQIPEAVFKADRPEMPPPVVPDLGPGPAIPPPVPEKKGPDLAPFPEPPNPFPKGKQTKLRAAQTFKAPGNAVQLVYSSRNELLFLRNSGSGIWVVDARSAKSLGMQSAGDTLTDMSLAPDESVLFAADYNANAKPGQPSHVHRYDLADRKWEKRATPRIAYRIEAADRGRFLTLEQNQWVQLSLNRWEQAGNAVTELASIGCSYGGDIEYDPRTGRIYHGNAGVSSPEITVRRIDGDGLKDAGSTGTSGTASKGGGGSPTLASDGSRFYYGALQVEALDVRHNLNTFPEVILAASRDLAFGKKACYDAQTAKKVGDLEFETTVLTVSRDGMFLWAFNPTTTTLHQYALEADK